MLKGKPPVHDSLVIIPTYNEKENIGKVLKKVFALPQPFDVLVIDDNSPDGSADLVKSHQQAYGEHLYLIERSGKQGLGTAYIEGFRWALEQGYTYIFEMDADFSHNPEDLPRLYQACAGNGYHVAVGSRYVPGGKVENWPLNRILISYFASVYVRCFTWMPVKDTTAGFVCYHRKVLQAIDLDKIRFIGYAFQIEMKFAAWKLGFKLTEVPITFVDRTVGESKMSRGIFKEAVWGVLKMACRGMFYSYGTPRTAMKDQA